jgi:hypothetical protein
MPHFPRPDLAKKYADMLDGGALLSDASNGLFLAGPRRTGKSAFIKNDLMIELQRRGVLTIYVDLWEDPKRDPAALIADAIGGAINESLGFVAKAVKRSGVKKVAGMLEIDTAAIGKVDGPTLYDALAQLHAATDGKRIALVIDEAQHALTSVDGEAAMFALKSARDQMKSDGTANLMLIMSGSHRDKLMRLVNTQSAPFWGSRVETMPQLGAPFSDFVADALEAEYPQLRQINRKVLAEAFLHSGERPEFFYDTLRDAVDLHPSDGDAFAAAALAAAQQRQSEDRKELTAQFQKLDALGRLIFERMLALGEQFRAYDADSLKSYSDRLGKPINATSVQRKLETMREGAPPLLWKSTRGEYAPYDQAFRDWYSHHVAAMTLEEILASP